MNFYRRYPGDYARDTGHLSLAEHGAYTVLLDHYYSTEQPLPGSFGALYRICRAMDEAEQAAVRTVAEAYFPLAADGSRHNHRADEEVAVWTERAETNRINGKLGGRPRTIETNPVSKAVISSLNEAVSEAVSESEPANNPNPEARSQNSETKIQNPESESPSLRSGAARAGERRSKRMPQAYTASDAVTTWAAQKAPGVNLAAEIEAIKDHEFRVAHSDWDAVVRSWCRREQKEVDRRAKYQRQPEMPVRQAREFNTQ